MNDEKHEYTTRWGLTIQLDRSMPTFPYELCKRCEKNTPSKFVYCLESSTVTDRKLFCQLYAELGESTLFGA